MATSIGSLYGWTEAELLVAMRLAASDLASGRTVISAGSGDVNSTKQNFYTPKERIEEIKANLGTLYTQDPDTYPQYEGFTTQGCNVVRANFGSVTY